MSSRITRKSHVAWGLVAVAGVAGANLLGPGEGPIAEVTVTAKRALPAEGVLAEVQVTAKRERSGVVELAMADRVPTGPLVQ